VAAGIAVDKMLLLRKESPGAAAPELTDEERLERLHALAERVRKRREGLTAPEAKAPEQVAVLDIVCQVVERDPDDPTKRQAIGGTTASSAREP
jgi:hypothetical protein